MARYTIGVDVGGTNVKFGLVNDAGKIISRTHLDTRIYARNKNKLIDGVVQCIHHLIDDRNLKIKNIKGIGVGLPGLINSKQGIVNFLPNIPGWRNVPLRSIIQKKIKIPVFIDNDVNLITLGEWQFGAGKKHKNLICITLGTGVGSGIVLNNALYRGEEFVAGELGHIPINEKGAACNCGGKACLETYVGNQVLMAKAGKLFKNKNIKIEDVYDLANKGNVRAVQFFEEAATHIGVALVGVVNLLNPQLIIIGGGVSNNYKYMGNTIAKIIKSRSMRVQAKSVKLVRCKLGDDAGILGAKVLVKEGISGS